MNFAFSEEQDEFREMLRRFLEEKSPSSEVRKLMETPDGYDRGVWKQMAEELGLQGLHLPEAYGGQGFSFLELGIVFQEMGRVLLCSPYFSTVALAANAILNAGTEAQKRALLPGIAKGEVIATLALLEEGRGWAIEGIAIEAREDGEGYRIDGVKTLVTAAPLVDLFVVAARIDGELALLTVQADAEGLSVTPLEPLDPTRRLGKVEFANVSARRLGEPGDAAERIQRTLDQATVMLALESCGGAQWCLDDAVAYAKERMQFGRPIGSFQAIKHKCAEMLLEVEGAVSASYWASWVAAERDAELQEASSIAASLSSDAYNRVAAENIQIHGGMGTTWEADPQLYFKRAKSSESLLGDLPFHRDRLTRLRHV